MYLELRHLRYFLAVAEELNFSRAAERLHVAQPALSAQIRALEAQLGCDLFTRTTRRVELTPAGEALVDDARAIVGRVDDAIANVRAVARGERGRLRVGFFVHGAGELSAEIIRRFAEEFPAVEIEFVSAPTLEATQYNIRDRVTDVAFVWRPIVCDELVDQPLVSQRLGIGMRPDHPLVSKPVLTVEDVTPEPIVAPYELVSWETLGPWLSQFRPDGRRSDDPNGRNHDECLAIASRGDAVYCAPESVWLFNPRQDLVFRPVVGAPEATISVAWHPETQNPAVPWFVDVALAAARTDDPEPASA